MVINKNRKNIFPIVYKKCTNYTKVLQYNNLEQVLHILMRNINYFMCDVMKKKQHRIRYRDVI